MQPELVVEIGVDIARDVGATPPASTGPAPASPPPTSPSWPRHRGGGAARGADGAQAAGTQSAIPRPAARPLPTSPPARLRLKPSKGDVERDVHPTPTHHRADVMR
ncbi:hypothetical protein ABZ281_30515 [Streptomyces sp. NPDC006265]|uniref:hypothetical protein n=1 Tax=Streptomyces sp. NPDC006265 TaxID=3156740 RepID=UPI0033A26EB3